MITHTQLTGYASAEYASSLAEFGQPVFLPLSGGWLLQRSFSGHKDAMGLYPLFGCDNWHLLESDFEKLGDEYISVTLVSDPFSGTEREQLQSVFPDKCAFFKSHYVVDLTGDIWSGISKHHRRNIRAALKQQEISRAEEPHLYLDAWSALYENLVRRHVISGLQAFSRHSFYKQLRVPGMNLFVAADANGVLAMQMWLQQGDKVYYHLGAANNEGYDKKSAYSLMWQALNYFARIGVTLADLGAGAGAKDNESGLTRYKKGWGGETYPVYLCGRILNHELYNKLSAGRSNNGGYFPQYRAGELTG